MQKIEGFIIRKFQIFFNKYGQFFITYAMLFSTLLFFEYLFKVFFRITFFQDKVIYSAIHALFLTCFISLFKTPKSRKIALISVMSGVTFLYAGQGVHFRAFRSLALLEDLSKLGTLGGVADSILEFLSYDLLLFLIPLLMLTAFYLLGGNKLKWAKERLPLRELGVFVVVGLIALTSVNSIKINVDGDINKERFRNSTLYFKKYGLIDTMAKEVKYTITNEKKKYEKDVIDAVETNLKYVPEKNKMTNQYKGKNLVFIEAESIAPYAIHPKLTPSLYKLQQEGINFSNYFSSRVNTFESEYAMLNSFYLSPEKLKYPFTSGGTMPTLFKQEGYHAYGFHDYISASYMRDVRYPELGFDEFHSAHALGLNPDNAPDFPSDEDFFRETFPFYGDDEEPFFSYHITMSAHASYDEEKRPSIAENLKRVREVYPDFSKEVQVYLAAAMQTDQGVGQLLDDLEKQGIYDDTVIVFVGDHYPYALRSGPIEEAFDIQDSLYLYKVPMIIWDASQPNEEVTHLMTNLDILPTLSNMFDLDLKYAMGHDVFSSNRSKIMVNWHGVRSYSFLTPDGGFDGDLNKIYGDLTEEEVRELQELSYQHEEWSNSEYVRNKLER